MIVLIGAIRKHPKNNTVLKLATAMMTLERRSWEEREGLLTLFLFLVATLHTDLSLYDIEHSIRGFGETVDLNIFLYVLLRVIGNYGRNRRRKC